MALFTDGNISTIEDLQAYDSAALEVANTHAIDLSGKLKLAEQELGVELEAFLARRTGASGPAPFSTKTTLGQVVVTTPLKQWHVLRALALVYGDVYNSQLNDRYRGKWKEYVLLAKSAFDLLGTAGVGLAADPVRRADPPTVSGIGGTPAPATYLVKVAWRNSSGQSGAVSEATVYTATTAQRLVVGAVNAPSNATGFDVYAGLAESEISKQNQAAIAANSDWTMPDTGLQAGDKPGDGQAPSYFLRLDRVLQRG